MNALDISPIIVYSDYMLGDEAADLAAADLADAAVKFLLNAGMPQATIDALVARLCGLYVNDSNFSLSGRGSAPHGRAAFYAAVIFCLRFALWKRCLFSQAKNFIITNPYCEAEVMQ